MGCKDCALKNEQEVPYRGNPDAEIVFMYECYDDKTEVLTNSGFKFFNDLDGGELFYSLNPETNNIELVPATHYIKKQYAGEMYKIKNYYIDLVITPNHRLYKTTRNNSPFKFEEIQSIKNPTFKMKDNGNWEGNVPLIDKYRIQLFGFWIGDGWTGEYCSKKTNDTKQYI